MDKEGRGVPRPHTGLQSTEIHQDTTSCTVTAVFQDVINKQMSKPAGD